mmetsp:Transcript_2885/g.4069  ORF Transcript_2885/g.4069 Transcript_2885/m.4069 type:complete len:263 (+) Transcript_2885:3-791(+)
MRLSPTVFWNAHTESVKYALWSVLSSSSSNARVVIGQVQKHRGNPLLVQDKPWDCRWDNSYPNIELDSNRTTFHLWYGGVIACQGCKNGQGHNRTFALQYANSSDGKVWLKPDLGIFDLSQVPHISPSAMGLGTHNNILSAPSDGVGVFLDHHDQNASRKYKFVGKGCFEGNTSCIHGTAVSSDGLHWTDTKELQWPPPQRWDDHQNIFYDEALICNPAPTSRCFVAPSQPALHRSIGFRPRVVHHDNPKKDVVEPPRNLRV